MISSTQVSSLLSGQQVMFSNQAAYSQQISGMAGTGPSVGGGLQNPYPSMSYGLNPVIGEAPDNFGSRVVGGASGAMGGSVFGAQVMAGFAGGAVAGLDPFTGVGRGFARGAGAPGAGFGGTLDHLGSVYNRGGMSALGGSMMRGVGAGAVAALPYWAAGQAVDFAAGNIWQGAQNVSDVGSMTGHFGTQFGSSGSRSGGLMGRGNIKQITGILEDLASDDVVTTMDSLKNLMDKVGNIGMLHGISSPEQFKDRFGKIVSQVKSVAQILGSTMEEAMPLFSQMQGAGVWSASDVTGTAVAAKLTGAAGAPVMMGGMQAGAQMSHALGGRLGAGGLTGREAFLTARAAVSSGVMSNEDLMEFTGGVGGVQGMGILGRKLTAGVAQFGQSPLGTMALAGLGETSEGRFTGGIDQERLRQLMSGEIGVGGLSKLGRQSTRTKAGRASFERRMPGMSQELASEGGIEAITKLVQGITDEKFGGDEDMRHHLFTKLMGASDREAELYAKLADNMPTLLDERSKENEAIIDQAFRDLDTRLNRSWEGFRSNFGQAFSDMGRPLRDMGASLSTSIGEYVDSTLDDMWGRTRVIAMSQGERARLIQGGSMYGKSAAGHVDFSSMDSNLLGDTMATRMAHGGSNALWASAAGAAVGFAAAGPLGGVIGGAATFAESLAVSGGHRGRVANRLGLKKSASDADIATGLGRARRRAGNQVTLGGLSGFGGEAGRDKALNTMTSALRSAADTHLDFLMDAKSGDPETYHIKLLNMMKKVSPELRQVLKGKSGADVHDLMQLAIDKAGFTKEGLGVDWSSIATGIIVPTTPEGLVEFQRSALESMQEVADPWFDTPLLSGEDITSLLTGENVRDVYDYLTGDAEAGSRLRMLAGKDDRMGRFLQATSDEDVRQQFGIEAGKFIRGRSEQSRLTGEQRARRLATANKRGEDIRGLSAGTASRFTDVLEKYETGSYAEGLLAARELSGDITDAEMRALSGGRGGSVGAQITGLKMVSGMGAMSSKAAKRFMKRLGGASGYGISSIADPELRKRMEEAMEGGLDENEAAEMKEALNKSIATGLGETTAGRRSSNEIMKATLTQYTDANTRFVNAVNNALGKEDIDLKTSSKELQSKKDITNLWGFLD